MKLSINIIKLYNCVKVLMKIDDYIELFSDDYTNYEIRGKYLVVYFSYNNFIYMLSPESIFEKEKYFLFDDYAMNIIVNRLSCSDANVLQLI